MNLTYILIFSLIGSVGAIMGAGLLLFFPKFYVATRTILVSYAAGALLAAAFLGVLPEAIIMSGHGIVMEMVLAGFFMFWVIGKALRLPSSGGSGGWRRIQHLGLQPAAFLILIGDAFHNFVDGVLIATAFSVSTYLGIVTALAAVAHEIPQELGDFIVLLESKLTRRQAFSLNLISSLTTVLGALLTYLFRESIAPWTPYVLAVSAASFLYISTVELIPSFHSANANGSRSSLEQAGGMILGIVTIYIVQVLSTTAPV